jgi:hypothetical protein
MLMTVNRGNVSIVIQHELHTAVHGAFHLGTKPQVMVLAQVRHINISVDRLKHQTQVIAGHKAINNNRWQPGALLTCFA